MKKFVIPLAAISLLLIVSLACSLVPSAIVPTATVTASAVPTHTEVSSPTTAPTYTPAPTYTLAPTYTVAPTYTLQPTYTPASTYTPEPTQVMEAMFTPNQPVFCRTGPSEQVWWDPQEALNEGQTVKIIGKSSSEWGLWWYIQKASGSRCWVYSELGSTTGNIGGVPVVSAPATPVPQYIEVRLRNNQPWPICQVWIENAGAGNWVELLEGLQLEVGENLRFSVIPGRYDIEIYDCGNNLIDAGYNFKIDSGAYKFTTP